MGAGNTSLGDEGESEDSAACKRYSNPLRRASSDTGKLSRSFPPSAKAFMPPYQRISG